MNADCCDGICAGFANNLLAQLNLAGTRDAGALPAQMPLLEQLNLQEIMLARRPNEGRPSRNVRARTNPAGSRGPVPANNSGAPPATGSASDHHTPAAASGTAPPRTDPPRQESEPQARNVSRQARQAPTQGSQQAPRGSGGQGCSIQ